MQTTAQNVDTKPCIDFKVNLTNLKEYKLLHKYLIIVQIDYKQVWQRSIGTDVFHLTFLSDLNR